jgi:hypothetical protein
MSRYKFNKIHSDKVGNRYRNSTLYNKIPLHENDMFVEASMHDRLDNIAHQFYGNRDYWWIIAVANQIGKGTLYIKEPTILRLPINPQEISNRLKNISRY